MNSRFQNAEFDPYEDLEIYKVSDAQSTSELQQDRQFVRYRCAALLPVFAELAEDVLPRLKKRIRASDPTKARTASMRPLKKKLLEVEGQ
jgi:hypothetical protein